ncbi:MAG: SUMF1/EgtB/PvdO family nonheme iron enzyme [Gammaproteobacteria bacterium]|nr:SUMF1/EgtB/PvdO family nonheme iron enzyme [Gammaproteobacteria bacterium]
MKQLDILIQRLENAELEREAKELADLLWLARFLPKRKDKRVEKTADKREDKAAGPSCEDRRQADKARPAKFLPLRADAPRMEQDAAAPEKKPEQMGERPFRACAPLMIPDALLLARALRPLRRRIPSRRDLVLDEAATVHNFADLRLPLPALHGKSERWLELALVADGHDSLILWEPLLDELLRLLQRHGAFRDVRLWRLEQDRQDKILLRPGLHGGGGNPAHLLHDPEGRRIVLVASDFTAPAWRKGSYLPVMRAWARHQPLALLHLLPQRLWRRTGLATGHFSALAGAARAGALNRRLPLHPDETPAEQAERLRQGLKLPLFSLTPGALNVWAGLINGQGGIKQTAVIYPLAWRADRQALNQDAARQSSETSKPLQSDARWRRFLAGASPQARQLAEHCAPFPLTLPVVRLIQESFFPGSRPGDLAELFLGGIVHRAPEQLKADPAPLEVVYDFHDGIRQRLLNRQAPEQLWNVLKTLSEQVEQHLGGPHDFLARIADPAALEPKQALAPVNRPFAYIRLQVLRRLGGVYAEWAAHLAEVLENESDAGALEQPNLSDGEGPSFSAGIAASFRDPLKSGGKGPEMVSLENTLLKFKMGGEEYDNEKPVHEVVLSPFSAGKYPVTAGEFKRFVEEEGYKTEAETGDGAWVWGQGNPKNKKNASWQNPYFEQTKDNPAVCISWNDAQAYCQWLNGQSGEDYRLLTEAEWEYACRAGNEGAWCFGDDEKQLGDYAWYNENSNNKTHPVGEKNANAFGLCDMHGNVWEWCQDWYSSYSQDTVSDPAGADSGTDRVLRGGPWYNDGRSTRSANRSRNRPGSRDVRIGFRLARGQKGAGQEQGQGSKTGQAERVGQVLRKLRQGNPWAKRIEQDEYGVYAEFEYEKVVQRMRLIAPGRFLMGSPESEPERYDDEHQHEVILTKGFWLADTACTQALWQAVTGNKPSRFKGPENPVEKVNWNDAQEFLQTLNKAAPQLNLRLPAEAEWEYACRAGTGTPFWFGNNITPEQVNYNGNYPYADGQKGLYRKKTVPVKKLPCNAWGLYQMHGNVWEWCQDWYSSYPQDTVSDPAGPDSGTDRVLRGGSWYNYGLYTRSALRNRCRPDYRFDQIGFRLARGQVELRQEEWEQVKGSKTGQTERSGVGQVLRKKKKKRKKR